MQYNGVYFLYLSIAKIVRYVLVELFTCVWLLLGADQYKDATCQGPFNKNTK